MMLGMSLSTFTAVHVIISLIGILSGIIDIGRAALRQTDERLDGALSVDHGFDQRDWVRISLHSPFTCAQGWHHFAGLGDCDPGRVPHAWHVALDLCGDRHDCPLSQCLRPGECASFEGAGPESDGADPIRAAVSGGATGGAGAVHRPDYFCDKKIPSRFRSLIRRATRSLLWISRFTGSSGFQASG